MVIFVVLFIDQQAWKPLRHDPPRRRALDQRIPRKIGDAAKSAQDMLVELEDAVDGFRGSVQQGEDCVGEDFLFFFFFFHH